MLVVAVAVAVAVVMVMAGILAAAVMRCVLHEVPPVLRNEQYLAGQEGHGHRVGVPDLIVLVPLLRLRLRLRLLVVLLPLGQRQSRVPHVDLAEDTALFVRNAGRVLGVEPRFVSSELHYSFVLKSVKNPP